MDKLLKQVKEPEQGRKVYILRHGQTKLNAEDKIRAWIDIPLDDVGIEQAQDLGDTFRKDGVELDGLICSDLVRAVQTGLIVSTRSGIPILGTSKALRPWDVGTYSGTDGPAAHKVMMEHAYNKPDEQVGGGESFTVFKHRVLGGIVGFLNANRGLKLGFVSHSRGERILHAWVAAGCPEDLEVDLEVFGEKGEGTATAQELVINCPLVLS